MIFIELDKLIKIIEIFKKEIKARTTESKVVEAQLALLLALEASVMITVNVSKKDPLDIIADELFKKISEQLDKKLSQLK